MRKQSINERIIIETGKEIIKTDGIKAINMRTIASKANISLGSIYNYYKNKDELLLSLVKSIWLEILDEKGIETTSFIETVSLLFESIEKGNCKYPNFIKIHFISFNNKKESRVVMEEIVTNIKSLLLVALKNDNKLKNIFDESFNEKEFVDFIFENMMMLLLKNERKDYLLKLVNKVLYES